MPCVGKYCTAAILSPLYIPFENFQIKNGFEYLVSRVLAQIIAILMRCVSTFNIL